MDFKLITSAQDLAIFCNTVSDAEWLALDTEFIRERTYFPNLCLVQIASARSMACIDTLAIKDLSILKELLERKSIVKIFHSASQDLEIFVNLFDKVPTPIFDTQIAASLLGYGDQVSYAHLVSEICNIKLDKSLSRTNWERRPLSEKELRYAIDDVKYLAKVYLHLKSALNKTDRTHWAEYECEILSNIDKYKIDANKIWKSVKGAGKLNAQQLNTLKQLAKWREQQAIIENKPRRWVLNDKLLRKLAIEQPSNMNALGNMEDFDHEHLGYADILLEKITQAQSIPEHKWPEASTVNPLSIDQRKLVKQAQSLIAERAEQLNVSPGLLATKSTVEKLVHGKRDVALLSNWKKELIGDELIKLIETNEFSLPD